MDKPKAAPGEKGSPWTTEEEEALLAAFDEGATIEDLMKISKRTVDGIVGRLQQRHRLISVRGGLAKRDPFVWITYTGIRRLQKPK